MEAAQTTNTVQPQFSRYKSVRDAAVNVEAASPSPNNSALRKSMSRYRSVRPPDPPAYSHLVSSSSTTGGIHQGWKPAHEEDFDKPTIERHEEASHAAIKARTTGTIQIDTVGCVPSATIVTIPTPGLPYYSPTTRAGFDRVNILEQTRPPINSVSDISDIEASLANVERARVEAYASLTGEIGCSVGLRENGDLKDTSNGLRNHDRAPTTFGSRSDTQVSTTLYSPVITEPDHRTAHPGFDAPVSAVNSGQRNVTVKYNGLPIILPITTFTTVDDIIRAVVKIIPSSLDSVSMVVLECYQKVGLERPLRRYEHIRDTLNSWDRDSQNNLRIVSSISDDNEDDLGIEKVPKQRPNNTTLRLYHSNKPGSWDKRWVTLRTDGQILMAKHNGVDQKNICHMSDFDIYVPTVRQLKLLQSPKKLCFAVKSQQKSSVFLSTSNFIHFFATNDKVLAEVWFRAVQGWRSWYLVQVMGKGQFGDNEVARSIKTMQDCVSSDSYRPSNLISSQCKSSGKPLRDFGSRNIQSAYHGPVPGTCLLQDDMLNRMPNSTLYLKLQGGPPICCLSKPSHGLDTQSPINRDQGLSAEGSNVTALEIDPFAVTGLLGRTYTKRQVGPQSRLNQVRAASSHGEQDTSHSQPLVDLKAHDHETLRHDIKGHGIMPEWISAGRLVDINPNPETSATISIPPWRRPSLCSGDHVALHKRSTQRNAISSRHFIADEKNEIALTDAGDGSVGRQLRRGVKTGDRLARGPMLDFIEHSNYAPGSLLATVERNEAIAGMVADRENWKEKLVPGGKGR